MTRVVKLDGLRGVAIAVVLAYHSGALPHGWLGVHIFFALSGFLIAKALAEQPDLRAFYGRRAAKIAPAFLAYLAVAALAATIHGMPLDDFGWFAAMLGNYRISAEPVQAAGLLAHLWSVAVEVQIYVATPLLIAVARRRPLALIGAGVLLRCAWGVWLDTPEAWRAAPALDAFAAGLALALHPVRVSLPKGLSAPAVAWLGRISYSLYLWHPLVYAACGEIGFGPVEANAAAIAVAAVSFYAIERPLCRWGHRHFHPDSSRYVAPPSAPTLVARTTLRLPGPVPVRSIATPPTVIGVAGVPDALR